MKKIYDIIIIGGNISGIYAGIKFIELGYKVLIIDKKNYNNILYNNNDILCDILNNTHNTYINLLKKFNINFYLINKYDYDDNINENNKYYKIINIILEKSKTIPQNILLSLSFINLCKELLSNNNYEELINNIEDFTEIFNNISAFDAINIFQNDINNNLKYYNCDNNLLINKMINYYLLKKGEILNNIEINDISYNNNLFTLINSNNNDILKSKILISTISKKNLILLKFWRREQLKILNSVISINSYNIKNIFNFLNNYNNILTILNNNLNNYDKDLRNLLLDDLHIVYPIFKKKNKDIYFWNKNINKYLINEKIKKLYNNRFFICGESYCINNIFINYSLELIDNILLKICKIKLI